MARHLPLTFARIREGFTNRQLAAITEIGENRLSRIQLGLAHPTEEEAERLGAVLDVDPSIIRPSCAETALA